MSDETPNTDGRDPALLVTEMIDHVLALAATWTAWDGRPLYTDERSYTPHKAIRRVTDHLAERLPPPQRRSASRGDPQKKCGPERGRPAGAMSDTRLSTA